MKNVIDIAMSFILPLLFIICTAGSTIFLSGKRIEEILPLSLMISTLIVFITGLFNQLLIGYMVVLLIACAFPIGIIVMRIKKMDISKLKSNFLTPGLLVFVAIYSFVFILNFNKGITKTFDEFAHWGPMVKEILRLNKYYTVPESVSWIHKDYPPIVSLFEAMWCKMCGGYKEAYLYRSLQTLAFSLFMPVFASLNWKKNVKYFIKLICMILVVLSTAVIMTDGLFYKSVLVDSFLGLMFAYSVFIVLQIKEISTYQFVRLIITLAFLLLIKQMAVTFYMLVLGIFIMQCLLIHRETANQMAKLCYKDKIMRFVKIVCIAIIPYIFILLWNYYTAHYGIIGQFKILAIKLSQFIGIAKGTAGEPWQHQAFINFIKTLFTSELLAKPVSLAYWQVMLFMGIVFWIIARSGKKYFMKYQITSLYFLLLLGSIGYAAVMLLLYVFCFGPTEGPNLADFNRYMKAYLFSVIALAMMLFLLIEAKKEGKSRDSSSSTLLVVLSIIWTLFLAPSEISNFKPALSYKSTTTAYTEDVSIIRANTEQSDKVFIISQGSDVSVTYSIKYLIMPQDCNYMEFNLQEATSGYTWSWNLTPEAWINELISGGYNYVYLRNVDDYFIATYSEVFNKDECIRNNQLYHIIRNEDGTIKLLLVE